MCFCDRRRFPPFRSWGTCIINRSSVRIFKNENGYAVFYICFSVLLLLGFCASRVLYQSSNVLYCSFAVPIKELKPQGFAPFIIQVIKMIVRFRFFSETIFYGNLRNYNSKLRKTVQTHVKFHPQFDFTSSSKCFMWTSNLFLTFGVDKDDSFLEEI